MPLSHSFGCYIRPSVFRSSHCSLPFSRLHRSRPQWPTSTKRGIATETVLGILTPPSVFVCLTLSLWAYKCLMMIVFQKKIIYMPSMPPFSRSEKLADYADVCLPYIWREESLHSIDGTRIALCIGERQSDEPKSKSHVVVVYYQGNGASTPPRLPMLTNVLKSTSRALPNVTFTMVVPSYRGYWRSAGRPSEPGLRLDGQAALQWARQYASSLQEGTPVVLWGQSLGAAVAMSTATSDAGNVEGIILETPFTSMRDMLVALYPQKWLPYRYLWPFLTSNWDNEKALDRISRSTPILMVLAENDEVVPIELGNKLMSRAQNLGLNLRCARIAGALHHEATSKRAGREAVALLLKEVASKPTDDE